MLVFQVFSRYKYIKLIAVLIFESVCGIKWQNKIQDTVVLTKAGLPSIFTLLIEDPASLGRARCPNARRETAKENLLW